MFQISLLIIFIRFGTTQLVTLPSQCSREESRIVRNFLIQQILPLYEEINEKIPVNCLFHPSRDIFGSHESHKYIENPSKYVCEFCGKAFYDERFIDLHFHNRHKDELRMGPDSVCLNDHCDLFRCEVISGRSQPKFWDRVLCDERLLVVRNTKCQKFLSECVISINDKKKRQILLDKLNQTLCSYLTCELYWTVNTNSYNPLNVALCVFFIAIVLIGITIVGCAYYEQEVIEKDDTSDEEPSHTYHRPSGYYSLHRRHRIK